MMMHDDPNVNEDFKGTAPFDFDFDFDFDNKIASTIKCLEVVIRVREGHVTPSGAGMYICLH
jgi:hypothetical protein